MRIAADDRLTFPLRLVWKAPFVPENSLPMRVLPWRDRLFVVNHVSGADHATFSCLHARSGDLLWRREREAPGRTTIACVSDEGVIAYGTDWASPVCAYDLTNGEERWRNDRVRPGMDDAVLLDGAGQSAIKGAATGLDVNAAIALDSGPEASQTIVVLDRRTGGIVWSRQYDGALAWPQVAIGDALIVMQESDAGVHGFVLAVDVATGEVRWRRDLRDAKRTWIATTKEWEKGSVESVTTDGTRALCNVTGGALIALDPATGETLWQYDADGGGFMRPLPVGDHLYTINRSTFYCLDAFTGRLVFSESLGPDESWLRNTWCLADRVAIYGAGKFLIARHLDRGRMIWWFEGDANFAPPFAHGGRLYAGCLDGHVYCFEPQPE